jgi:hypothetical protein
VHTEFSQEGQVLQLQKPIGIVQDYAFFWIFEIDEGSELFLEMFRSRVDRLRIRHLSHIGFTRRVTDQRRATAQKNNDAMTCLLPTPKAQDREKVTDVQTISCWIKAGIRRTHTTCQMSPQLVLVVTCASIPRSCIVSKKPMSASPSLDEPLHLSIGAGTDKADLRLEDEAVPFLC